MSIDFMDSSLSDILSETNRISPLSFEAAPLFSQESVAEQENCNPSLKKSSSEPNKVPVHLRLNRTRTSLNRIGTQKQSKLQKVQKDLRSIIKTSNEKQLLRSQSFQLDTKEEYPTLLRQQSTALNNHKNDYHNLSLKDFNSILSVSCQDMNFGNVMPGAIFEKAVEVKNKSTNNLAVRIIAGCSDDELNQMDEYVFSVAEYNKLSYHEKALLVLPASSSVKFSLGLKVPNLKKDRKIEGSYTIEIIGLNKTTRFVLHAHIKIPKISCVKEIFDSMNQIYVMKFALKRGKKQDFKVSIKNESEFNLEGNFEILENQRNNLSEQLILYPATAKIEPFSFFTLSFMVKLKGVGIQGLETPNTLNKVLLFKIKNSSVIYFFALAIEFY